MSTSTSKYAALRTTSLPATVFAEFTALALKHKAVNLGQGFPTLPVADFILDAIHGATKDGESLLHQYSRSQGHPRLMNALANFYSPQLAGRKLDPMTNIISAAGASEAIYSTIQAFINPGDQVIMMQPFYDCYPAAVTLAGGESVFVSLKPKKSLDSSASSHDWKLDLEELRSKIVRGKTKMIMINNPHNPIGKVWTREELLGVAELAQEFDLLVLADEVYETLVYNDSISPMIKFASLPGMFERTISVGSAGKIFGVTGWKIGWCVGSAELIETVWRVHQFIPFCVATPLCEATAVAFEKASQSDYFEKTVAQYQSLRDSLYTMLKSNGLNPTQAHGGYFILADTSAVKDTVIKSSSSSSSSDHQADDKSRGFDVQVCKYLTREAGVTAIPPSAFYDPAEREAESIANNGSCISDSLARFAFCKNQAMLDAAGEQLKAWKLKTTNL